MIRKLDLILEFRCRVTCPAAPAGSSGNALFNHPPTPRPSHQPAPMSGLSNHPTGFQWPITR